MNVQPLPFLPVGDEMVVVTNGPWLESVRLDATKAILFGDDPTDVRFLHRCDRAHRNAGVIICAPRLQIGNGHTIVQRDPLTIVASILCSDCQTHGFVTNGAWT